MLPQGTAIDLVLCFYEEDSAIEFIQEIEKKIYLKGRTKMYFILLQDVKPQEIQRY